MSAEEAIQMTTRMYEMRRTLRQLSPAEDYKDRIAEFQGYIMAGMEKWGTDALPTTIAIATKIQKDGASSMAVMSIFAAYVEMIEPSKQNPKP